MHVEYGVPIALNAGDALATLALRPLLDEIDRLGSRMTRAVLAEFQRAMERTVEGQAVEIGWRADNVVDLTPVDYLDMILRKTCAYTTILPLRVGSLIGSWGAADLDAIAQYGFALGAAFQIQDDMLDLVSASGTYGKDLLGDVREGKRTLMLLHLVRTAAPHDRAFVEEFLADPPADRSESDVRRIADTHGRATAASPSPRATQPRSARDANARFDDAFGGCPDSQPLRFLRALVPFMVDRTS